MPEEQRPGQGQVWAAWPEVSSRSPELQRAQVHLALGAPGTDPHSIQDHGDPADRDTLYCVVQGLWSPGQSAGMVTKECSTPLGAAGFPPCTLCSAGDLGAQPRSSQGGEGSPSLSWQLHQGHPRWQLLAPPAVVGVYYLSL